MERLVYKPSCGCEVFRIMHSKPNLYRIQYCPKHQAVEAMYEALEGLNPCMRPVPGGETPYEWAISERAMEVVRKALALARGEPS